mgnify:FL=1
MYIALGIIVLLIIVFVFIYNKLVSLNVRCKNAYASIDNQLKRRADLIPNLVEVTKGYAKHESETLERIVLARTNSISEQAKQSEEVTKSLKSLLAVSESYPELKANELFKNLQIELTGTEDKIAYARQFYNDSVQHLNTAIMTFPNSLIASMFKFKEREYFEVSEEDKKVVKVQLWF